MSERFEGRVVSEWVKDPGSKDRTMLLLEDFRYVDPQGEKWLAPAGHRVNGASIPDALWSAVGSPYVGDYRRATVLHDVACDERTRPHDQVHKMFFDAMRHDGVSLERAVVMYKAVDTFGPRWPDPSPFLGAGETAAPPLEAVPNLSRLEVDRLSDAVEKAVATLGPDADLSSLSSEVDRVLQ